jgi:hypothetical protein
MVSSPKLLELCLQMSTSWLITPITLGPKHDKTLVPKTVGAPTAQIDVYRLFVILNIELVVPWLSSAVTFGIPL